MDTKERGINYAIYCNVYFNDTKKDLSDFIDKDLSVIKDMLKKNVNAEGNIGIDKIDITIAEYCNENGDDITKEEFEQEYKSGNTFNFISLDIDIVGSETIEYNDGYDCAGNHLLETDRSDYDAVYEIEEILKETIKEFNESTDSSLDFIAEDHDSNSERIEESFYPDDDGPDWDFLRDCYNEERDW